MAKLPVSQIAVILNSFVLNGKNVFHTAKECNIAPNTLRKILKQHPELMSDRKTTAGRPKGGGGNYRNNIPDMQVQVVRDNTLISPEVVAEKVALVQRADSIKLDFIASAYAAKEEAVQRLRDLINGTNSVDVLQKTIKTLHEITEKESSGSVINSNIKVQKINMLQVINNKLIAEGYGTKKPNPPQEDNQKPIGNNGS